MTFVSAKDPTQRAAKQYKKRKKTATTTSNGTELDQNPKDYKSNHSSQCPEQQQV